MENKMTCSLNYEAEYYRLQEEHKKLCAELADKNAQIQETEDVLCRLSAQMEVVYLIFGGRH